MALYRDRIFPRIMNRTCNTAATRRIRAEVCAALHGEVVEIGFGTGLNLPHLPGTVTRLYAVDPMQATKRWRDLAAERVDDAPVDVEFVGLDGQRIELPDDSVDTALSTWTLCTIPDAPAAVREITRVLRPGGTLHFAEHGRSPDADVRRWQDRLNPIQNVVACGCNLNRDIPALIEEGGMTVTDVKTFYVEQQPKVFGWMFQGIARTAA
jgi:ubiquinone/menaquinone biosynthesis C-methylase UbiE